MTTNRADHLLESIPELRELHALAKQHLEIQRAIPTLLSPSMALKVSVASLLGGRLLLITDNGPAAAKLRQVAPRLVSGLREQGFQVSSIQVQVQVRINPNPLPNKRISPGKEVVLELRRLAQSMECGTLQQALNRLAGEFDGHSDGDEQALERH